MEKVAALTMEGLTPTAIAKQLGLKRVLVLELQEDYRVALANDLEARDIAKDHLHKMVKHYDYLISRFYALIRDIDSLSFSHQVAGQKTSALRSIADLEAKRLDALQKAGLLESSELGDELADMEEKKEILINILRNDLCRSCQSKVAEKLTKVTGQVEVMATV